MLKAPPLCDLFSLITATSNSSPHYTMLVKSEGLPYTSAPAVIVSNDRTLQIDENFVSGFEYWYARDEIPRFPSRHSYG